MPRDDRLYYLKGLVLQKRGDFDPSILISDFNVGYMDSEGVWHHYNDDTNATPTG